MKKEMPPKNDIFQTLELKFGYYKPCDDIVAKVDHIEQTDAGLKIHCHKVEKEKKMKMDYFIKDIEKIVITKDGDNAVLCRGYGKNNLVVTSRSYCSPDDTFDFNIGAKLAMDRMYEGYDMTPKPKRKPLNGRIIVVWNEEVYDTFTVRDGKIESMLYVLRLPCQQKDTIYEDSSFEEMKQALLNCASFIWYGGKSPKAICRDYETYRK